MLLNCLQINNSVWAGAWAVGLPRVLTVSRASSGTERNQVELKGCSDISESTCETLAPENTTVGEFIFRSVICENATTINTLTTKTPPTSTGIKASFTSSVFGSLLLLKLLF